MKHKTLCLTALAAICFAGSAHAANVLTNSGFLFTTAGHTNGDNGSHAVGNLNPNGWSNSIGSGFIATDPQGIFNFTSEYVQFQGTGADLYQQVSVGSGTGVLSLNAMDRNDNIFSSGSVVIDLYAGHVTTFGGAAITADSFSTPALTTSIQRAARCLGACRVAAPSPLNESQGRHFSGN